MSSEKQEIEHQSTTEKSPPEPQHDHFPAVNTLLSAKQEKVQNPWALLTSLNTAQRLTFICAFLGWALDAFDYFIVTFAITHIADEFNMPASDITGSITVTLMLRPIGAIVFGLAADRWGRRTPLMIDVLLYSCVELASGFAPNFTTFIILRGVFGIAMGGEWGLGAALAMEVLPPESRGIFSGILQQGYATGYLLAAVFNYAVITTLGWRAMFWIGSFPAVLVLVIRFFVPESKTWQHQRELERSKKEAWLTELKVVIREHWRRFIYTVAFMACFNFMSHGTQDLYPTFLKKQLGFDEANVTVTLVIANVGAIIGGTTCGFYSQYWGRRRTIIVATFCAGLFIPLWILPHNKAALTAGAFGIYFFVQGAWGVVPAHLNELSPPSVRGTFPGLTYQLGNLISASSAQIEAKLGERFPTPSGKPNYGVTQACLAGIVMFCLILLTAFGKENREANFDELLDEEVSTNPTTEAVTETRPEAV